MNTSIPSLDDGCLAIAVIVLYRTSPSESVAFSTLSALLIRKHFESIHCVLYDNGPVLQNVPEQAFPVSYFHDAGNPGLAAAYNFGLHMAKQKGVPWLMLLDQDTQLTAAYLEEACLQAVRLRGSQQIVAIAPKLIQGDLQLSPHWPPRHPTAVPLRHQHGPIEPPLQVFNSGAWLRVAALTAIGGFPQQFPLDYLDHAVFTQLQQNGGRVYLLQAELQHDLAALHMDLVQNFVQLPRLQSILRAESRFYRTYGTSRDKFVYRLRRTRLLMRMILAGNLSGASLLLRCTLRPG